MTGVAPMELYALKPPHGGRGAHATRGRDRDRVERSTRRNEL